MKRRIYAALLSLLLVSSLTACGRDDAAQSSAVRQPQGPAEAPAETEAPTAPDAPVKADSTAADDARYAFGKVLWDAYLLGILPDGTPLDWTDTESAAKNDFILYDVDGDGREELLLYWGNASMAGMGLHVFDYADGAVYEELCVFPLATFYSNGVVKVDWSHNQGLAGNTDFWPYDLYAYDAETDTYQPAGSVDAWSSEQPAAAEEFPTDIDADGDGMVYFLLPADWDGSYSGGYLADGAEYEAWWSSCLDGGSALIIPTQKLAEDSIAALGCPKPDVPAAEPVG